MDMATRGLNIRPPLWGTLFFFVRQGRRECLPDNEQNGNNDYTDREDKGKNRGRIVIGKREQWPVKENKKKEKQEHKEFFAAD
jgi:hypothetical protein